MMQITMRKALRNLKSYRNVNTWSALATAFNTTTKEKLRFNLLKKETGLFGVPELKNADGFNVLKDHAIAQTNILIAEATSENRKRKMVEIFDELSDTLCKVADLAEFIRFAHPEKDFVLAAQDACITVTGVVEKLNTHRDLYNALRHVVYNKDIQETTTIDDHVGKLFLFDFEQSGIHLPEEKRQKVVELNNYILQVGQKFMTGAVNPRAVKAEILPENIRQ